MPKDVLKAVEEQRRKRTDDSQENLLERVGTSGYRRRFTEEEKKAIDVKRRELRERLFASG